MGVFPRLEKWWQLPWQWGWEPGAWRSPKSAAQILLAGKKKEAKKTGSWGLPETQTRDPLLKNTNFYFRIVLDLQRSYEGSRELPSTPNPICSLHIWHFHDMTFHNQGTNMGAALMNCKSTIRSDFLRFYLMSFPIPGFHPGYYVTLSHRVSLGFSWLWAFLRFSLFLMESCSGIL